MTRWFRLLPAVSLFVGLPAIAHAGWGHYHLCIADGTPPGASESAARSLQLFKTDMRKAFVADEPTIVNVASAEKTAAIFEPGCAGTVRDV